ncbi:hypothetical protein SNE26_04615 [Mucilaginibacter sp. cycad4]|uniref:hypothetical protein n=1 Tax=Mucilaginibacter sp. cycad4 TaxID=3342096 RepID=UPI002AAC2050|nr:hypothetical protein [Mucilaginibacter gossypii]WPV01047.1 hypothetical protein SNE26_04615 [Mucilaginibacter gossypii]
MGYGFYDITLYHHSENSNSKDLTIRNNLISDLYIDFLNGYKPTGTTRISVDIGNEDYIRGHFGSILHVEAIFNEKEYWLSSPENQNKIILDTIHRIAIFCAEKYAWDKVIFEQAYKKVKESGFIYKKELRKKLSQDKKHQACLLLEKNGNFTTISVNFYTPNGDFLKSIGLLKCFRDPMLDRQITTNNKWFNALEFGIYLKNHETVIKASLEKPDSETVISPVTNSFEELEGYLRRITYREFADKPDFVKWANQ